jgi:putative transposase
VKVRYRFRFYPKPEQEQTLARTFGAVRYVYNFALKLRTDSYREGVTINYTTSSAALTELKKQPDHAWLNEISSVPTQQSLRHLQTAFKNFFEKRSGYPTLKKKHGKQAAEYTRSAFKWDAATQALTVSQLGRVKIRFSRSFKSSPTTVTITKSPAGRYFVTFVLDETKEKLPRTGLTVGVDLGVNRLATLSNGEHIPNPKYLARDQRKLAHAQRTLSRRVKGSGRYARQKVKIAHLHERIANSRHDHVHKFTTDLVRRFDVICIEDLNVRGMVRNHHLARSLSDASLGRCDQLLTYKCAWYGKELRQVDRFFPSSKRCCDCGHCVASLPLSVRSWVCPNCGVRHDRDENASKNIVLAAGHAVSARGGRVRRKVTAVAKRIARRSVNHPAR